VRGRAPSRHWKRRCARCRRQQARAGLGTGAGDDRAAVTSTSLLASATVVPRRTREHGTQPGDTTIAPMTMSASPRRGRRRPPSGEHAHAGARAARAAPWRDRPRPRAAPRTARPARARARRAPPRRADHPEASGRRRSRAGRSRRSSGAAEEDHAARRAALGWRRRSWAQAARDVDDHRGHVKSRLSSTSSAPPMPGTRRPESFVLAARLSSDSARSPAVPAVAGSGRGERVAQAQREQAQPPPEAPPEAEAHEQPEDDAATNPSRSCPARCAG